MAEAKNETKIENNTQADDKTLAREVKEAGGQEVQERVEKELEQGFAPADAEPSPIPNEAYSLESGPDSPSAEDARLAVAQRDVERGRR